MNTPETQSGGSLEPVGSEVRCPLCKGQACVWLENPGGCHDTQCGHAFEFTSEGIKANGFKFCPFCGKTITDPNDQAHT
jgi:hypothetical protein